MASDWLAARVCQIPIVVLGDAVRQVLYQNAAAQFNRGGGLLGILPDGVRCGLRQRMDAGRSLRAVARRPLVDLLDIVWKISTSVEGVS